MKKGSGVSFRTVFENSFDLDFVNDDDSILDNKFDFFIVGSEIADQFQCFSNLHLFYLLWTSPRSLSKQGALVSGF